MSFKLVSFFYIYNSVMAVDVYTYTSVTYTASWRRCYSHTTEPETARRRTCSRETTPSPSGRRFR